jgi:hypothetical protein
VIALAELIERFEPELLQHYGDRLLPSHRQALAAMKRCRTRFAPRMLAQCAACGEQRSVPHSCGHRACPHCQHHDSQRWLQRQLQSQVPATYFLVTFTLPAELRSLAWQHQRVVYALLMQCAWDTLDTFSRNDRQLRATPGAVGVLHTHNRRLDFHPHVHMVMPAAALDTKRKLWRTKRRRARPRRDKAGTTKQSAAAADGGGVAGGGYLFNHKALAKVFRAKVLDAIEHAGLTLPAQFAATWVVDCKAVGDGQKALLYLGRYLYRGVIQETDIVRCDSGQVTFRYRDAKTGKMGVRTLAGAAFLWLVLQHVLPKGLRRARNFGFLHPNSARAVRLLQLLHLHAAPAADASTAPTRPAWRCVCGQPMRVVCRRMPPLQPDAAGPGQPSRVVRPDKPERGQAHTMH